MKSRNTHPRSLLLAGRVRVASRSSSALLITLLTLALMTIIVVAVLSTMTWEVQSSRRSFESQKARGLATLALHTAVTQLRTALGAWDAPYGDEQGNFIYGKNPVAGDTLAGFETNAPTNYWSVSPGILTIWKYNSVSPFTNYPLFSYYGASTNLANLNAQAQDGTYPILGTSTPLQVYWVNVLANPTNSASANNQIIGRYAFWTDDENSKININTADGVLNTNFPSTYMGAGTPTEVSLMELTNTAGSTLSLTGASNMVAYARMYGFNSPRDMLNALKSYPPASGTASDLYNNNVFNLTMMSRSPDFNLFGQPKIALIPSNMTNFPYFTGPGNSPCPASFMWNLTTFQPLKEVFPSLSGTADVGTTFGVLPSLSLKDNYLTISAAGVITPTIYLNIKWPLVFECTESDANISNPNAGSYVAWNAGEVIANYLAGTNACAMTKLGSFTAGTTLTWPEFPGATSAPNYLSKYTARQIDSITAQIVDLAYKDTSMDAAGSGAGYASGMSAGFLTRGWLSGELVNGIGRSPKLDKIVMMYTASQTGKNNGTNYPTLNAKLYLETYLPSRFSGVSLFHESIANGGYGVGDFIQGSVVNWQDETGMKSLTNSILATIVNLSQGMPGLLPKLPANTSAAFPAGNGGGSIGATALLTNFSYWGNNLLATDQGADWNGNDPSVPDPDQALAATYHNYLFVTNGTPTGTYSGYGPANTNFSSDTSTNFVTVNTYAGSGQYGGQSYPVLKMGSFVKTGHNTALTDILDDFAPGQYRVVENQGQVVNVPISNNSTNGSSVVNIYGGVAVKFTASSGHAADPDPVPLDAERGSVWPATTVAVPGIMAASAATNWVGSEPFGQQYSETGETFFNSSLSTYTNVLNAVIPMGASVPVPSALPVPGSSGATVSIYATVNQGDILVNKFPGDWTTNAALPSGNSISLPSASYVNPADGSNATVTSESSTTLSQMTDPDAFWLPTIDNIAGLNYVYLDGQGLTITIDKPQMPRTARFPSIGYLNYVRTGIMPDSETGSYTSWHGTPYRLLNFSPSYSTTQKTTAATSQYYPDWAMLDLFYIPSSLISYGSPYELFAGTRTITPNTFTVPGTTNNYNTPIITYSNTNSINNMFLYGTYGGATSGRINPNGSVVYTTNANVPTPGITRTVPLQALLHGLVYNQTVTGATTYGNADWLGTNDFHYPSLSAGTAVTPSTIAADIANYLTTNTYMTNTLGANVYPAPLREPAEICNIPTIAAAMPSSTVSTTRNDLARQIIGNLTTQSNTFSVWVEAQSITKSKVNLANDVSNTANYGAYESGDQITGTVRYHFIVERDLDPGIDGVYGNAASAGSDGVVGTLDDPASTYSNPQNPAYFYKIIYAEEVR